MYNGFSNSKAAEKLYPVRDIATQAADSSLRQPVSNGVNLNDIEEISVNTGIPADEVKRVYNLVLKRFQRGARIRDFLPILVSRRVKRLLYIRIRSKGSLAAMAH